MSINHAALAADLGKVFGGLKELNDYRGTTLLAREATLRTEYSTDPHDLLNNLRTTIENTQRAADVFVSDMVTLVRDTIVEVVNADRVLPDATIDTALAEWERQLRNDAQTFNDCLVNLAFAAAAGAPAIVADYTFHTSDIDTDGRRTDFGIPDKYLLTVLLDADNGGTRWAETLSIVSKAGDESVLDASYPTGTNINSTIDVVDPNVSFGVVTDGTFDTYTSGAFTNWTRLTGNTATEVFQTADDLRNTTDGWCMSLKSDGADVTGVKQTIAPTAGTVYSLHFAVNRVNAADAGAKVYVSVRRADTDAVLTDDQGVAMQQASGTIGSLVAGTWVHYTAAFAMPTKLPAAGVYLDIRLADGTVVTTPALINTEIKVDHVALVEFPTLYDRGVRLVAYSGKIEPNRRDQWEYTVTLAAGVIADYFIRWMDRTIGLASRELKLPTVTGGTETILDSVVA